MRILMVLDREFPPDIRVENEIEALIAAGHNVHIACYTRKNNPVFEQVKGLTIHRKKISAFIYKSSLASLVFPFYFKYWKKFLHEIIQTNSFDVIHVHDLPLVSVGAVMKKKFGLKLVADLHENWPAYLKISKHANTIVGKIVSPVFLWKNYEKKVLQYADAIVVVVNEARERLEKLGIDGNKVTVVSNTINYAELEIETLSTPHTGLILYYAGGINYHRGLQTVIKALGITKKGNCQFWILGEGSYKKKLEKLTRQFHLNDKVIFKGYQPFKKVMEMLMEADFAVIPHLKSEHTDSTIPHKLFQYMFAKKPVLASDCLPIKRIVEEAGCGIIYSSKNFKELADILDNFEPSKYPGMGENGNRAVIEKYNWKNDGNNLVKLYKELSSK